MTTATLPDEGVVIIPRKIGFWAVAGGILYLITTFTGFAVQATMVSSEISALQRADTDSRARGDEIRRRIDVLERDRNSLLERLTRVEEQNRQIFELTREIRDVIRKRP